VRRRTDQRMAHAYFDNWRVQHTYRRAWIQRSKGEERDGCRDGCRGESNCSFQSGASSAKSGYGSASIKPTTTIGAVFGAMPAMPGFFRSNLDRQLVRGMCAGAHGEVAHSVSCTRRRSGSWIEILKALKSGSNRSRQFGARRNSRPQRM